MGKKSKSNKTKDSIMVIKNTSKKNRSDEDNTKEKVSLDEIPKATIRRESNEIPESKEKNILAPQSSKIKTKKRRKSTADFTNDVTVTENKKITFEDDKEVQRQIKKPKKKHLNDEDAEVKEEDIDKFCDELDEEDNEQYENWVKLIEANLKSNKKKE